VALRPLPVVRYKTPLRSTPSHASLPRCLLCGKRTAAMSIVQDSGLDPFAQGLWDSSSAAPPSAAAAAAELPGMQVDWKETGEVHVIKADLPGVRREEVKVELESGGRVLQISGERRREVQETGDTWRQVERSSGRFMRRLSLPANAKVEGVKASMEHGVLTVVVPKAEVNQPRLESAQMSG
ncbi:unnamed protein product, partial [Musa textilis]